MKYMFLVDVGISLCVTLALVTLFSLGAFNYVSVLVGAIVHLLVRSVFLYVSISLWNDKSEYMWEKTLSRKNYKTEISASSLTAVACLLLGAMVWSGFYAVASFFMMWCASQFVELMFLLYNRTEDDR